MSDLEGLEYRAEVYKNIDGKVIGVHADDYLHLERRLQKLRDELSDTKKDVTDMDTRALEAEAERDILRAALDRLDNLSAHDAAIVAAAPRKTGFAKSKRENIPNDPPQ